jgi:hypothetical protein
MREELRHSVPFRFNVYKNMFEQEWDLFRFVQKFMILNRYRADAQHFGMQHTESISGAYEEQGTPLDLYGTTLKISCTSLGRLIGT